MLRKTLLSTMIALILVSSCQFHLVTPEPYPTFLPTLTPNLPPITIEPDLSPDLSTEDE